MVLKDLEMLKLKIGVGILIAVAVVVVFATTAKGQSTGIDFASLTDDQRAPWGIATDNRRDEFLDTRSVNRFKTGGWALQENSGRVYVGGKFPGVTDGEEFIEHPWLAAFELETGEYIPGFAPQTNGVIFSLENAPDGDLIAAGEFSSWNGEPATAIVKFDPITGEADPDFNVTLSRDSGLVVRDLYIGSDGFLYLAGGIDRANDGRQSVEVQDVVRVDLDTYELDRGWLPEFEGFDSVWGIAKSFVNENVYIVGWTPTTDQDLFGDELNRGVKVVSADNAAEEVWRGFRVNDFHADIYDVETTEAGTVWFGGTEHAVYVHDELNNLELIRSHVSGADSLDTFIRRGGDVQDLEVIGDQVVATCHCWGAHLSVDGGTQYLVDRNVADTVAQKDVEFTGEISAFAVYDAATGVRDESFIPRMSGDSGGWATLGASDGCFWITGGITSIGEVGTQQDAGRELVRFCGEDEDIPEPALVPPERCSVVIAGETVNVSWSGVDGADSYVISRSVDGSRQFWRGLTEDESFVDTNVDGELLYTVLARSGNDRSEPVDCGEPAIEAPPVVALPTSCGFSVVGDVVEVSWQGAEGAIRHAVYRSVDGSAQFWRGVVEQGNSFTDSARGETLDYFVLAVFADGSRSERVSCGVAGVPEVENPPVATVASCSVNENAAGVRVTWDAVTGVDAQYVVSRSVDGGNVWWRGLSDVNAVRFDDTVRAGSIQYFVATKVGNETSEPVPCNPTLTIN